MIKQREVDGLNKSFINYIRYSEDFEWVAKCVIFKELIVRECPVFVMFSVMESVWCANIKASWVVSEEMLDSRSMGDCCCPAHTGNEAGHAVGSA